MRNHLLRRTLAALVMAWTALCTPLTATAEVIVSAQYAAPVLRYGHFALGQPHESSMLVARTDAGRTLQLELPQSEVFEDLAPRLVWLRADGAPELLTIVSSRSSGSRLALVELDGSALKMGAQSAPVGTPMRWLNPVGVADLDGDGHAEIAAVITPHIGGTLKVYKKQHGTLMEIASMAGFSNHVYGTPELALSLPVRVHGQMRLLVPDATRSALRLIGLENRRLVELGRCDLPLRLRGLSSQAGRRQTTNFSSVSQPAGKLSPHQLALNRQGNQQAVQLLNRLRVSASATQNPTTA